MAGTWQGLTNQPPFSTSTMLLLTDGRVMAQEEGTQHWYALTPDTSGSYVDGSWSALADMAIFRRYYASAILRDGRVIVIGGEQSSAGDDTNRGEIYDPVADAWTPIPPPPGWAMVGDASCCLLPNGTLMIGALVDPRCAIFHPETDSWSPAASKAVRSNEETWILLPDESIVTVQCFEPYRSERYGIASNAWKDEGRPPVPLVDPIMHEIGPAMLTYDGKVIWFGAANVHGRGRTAIYTPPSTYTGTGTWAVGPDIPTLGRRVMVCNDCPATLMPNGKVLFAAAEHRVNDWGAPIYLFEYDPFTGSITQAPTPTNNAMQLYWSRMMLLPTGQVLFGPSIADIQCYTPDGQPQEAWRPVILDVTPHCTRAGIDHYVLRGRQLNGLSQANIYGDDVSAATSYPLVRLRSVKTGHVHYCRTYDFSTMAIATGPKLETLRFETIGVPYGDFELCVVANGIASHCIGFCHRRVEHPCACGGKCPVECCGKGPEMCCCDEETADPMVARLRSEVGSLSRTLQRARAAATEKPAPRQEKERRAVSAADRRAAQALAAPERKSSAARARRPR
jgi:Kelch motif protein